MAQSRLSGPAFRSKKRARFEVDTTSGGAVDRLDTSGRRQVNVPVAESASYLQVWGGVVCFHVPRRVSCGVRLKSAPRTYKTPP